MPKTLKFYRLTIVTNERHSSPDHWYFSDLERAIEYGTKKINERQETRKGTINHRPKPVITKINRVPEDPHGHYIGYNDTRVQFETTDPHLEVDITYVILNVDPE